jgi:hypothetical protein
MLFDSAIHAPSVENCHLFFKCRTEPPQLFAPFKVQSNSFYTYNSMSITEVIRGLTLATGFDLQPPHPSKPAAGAQITVALREKRKQTHNGKLFIRDIADLSPSPIPVIGMASCQEFVNAQVH